MSKQSNIPQLRFKGFDGEWEINELGNLSKITSGGTPSRNNNKFWNGNIPWISTSFINFNTIETAEEYITQEAVSKSSAKLFPKGTILMAMYGQGKTRGKVAVLGIDATTNQACGAILTNENINTDYLFQNLASRYDEIRDLSNEGGQQNLSGSIIKSIEIRYPTLPEQEKIASFLSAVDERIQQLTRKAALLEQYKKGVMQQLFSGKLRFKDENGEEYADWEEKKLGDLCKISTGKLDANAMVENGEYRFYTCAKDYFKIDKYAFDTEALLISGNGANVGYIHYYKGKFNAYQRTYVLDSIKENIIYLKFFLDKFLYERIHTEKKEGNTPYIVMSTLSEMEIQIPSIPEQKKIAGFLSGIDEKIGVVQGELLKMQGYKKGLLQRMFV